MPDVFRSAPAPGASVVTAPLTDGSVAPATAWLEVPIEARTGFAAFSYFLAAKAGLRSFANAYRRSP
ncbi:MAG: hypothetical protein ABIS21_03210 [Acidimicrobiales bacterium]